MRINLHNLNITNALQAWAISAPRMRDYTQKFAGSVFVPHLDRQVGYMMENPFLKNIHI